MAPVNPDTNEMVNIGISNCMECSAHRVISDPDPHDWFCDDDKAVVCTETPNDKRDRTSEYSSDHSAYKVIQCGIRPYRLEKETSIPSWCPKRVSC